MPNPRFEVHLKDKVTGKTSVKVAEVGGGDYDEEMLEAHYIHHNQFPKHTIQKIVKLEPAPTRRLSDTLAAIRKEKGVRNPNPPTAQQTGRHEDEPGSATPAPSGRAVGGKAK